MSQTVSEDLLHYRYYLVRPLGGASWCLMRELLVFVDCRVFVMAVQTNTHLIMTIMNKCQCDFLCILV